MLFWSTTRDGTVRDSAQKGTAQESQRDTRKVPPFYFVPEGTSVPDVEEIQDSKGEFYKYTNIKISHQSRFSRKLVPCSSGLGVI